MTSTIFTQEMKSYAQKFAENKDAPVKPTVTVKHTVTVKPTVVVKPPVVVKTEVLPEVPRDGPWTKLGVTEAEYKVSRQRIEHNLLLWEQQRQAEIRQLPEHPSHTIHFWKMRHNMLENERQKLNRKAGWSATNAADADYLDAELNIVNQNLYDLYV